MIIRTSTNNKIFTADLSLPLDISIPIHNGEQNPNCYWADPVKFETIRTEDFTGSVKEGGSVNYQKLSITPHGNGTHTECYGHISNDGATLNQSLHQFHFVAELISVQPEKTTTDDFVISLQHLKQKLKHPGIDSIIIRTLPNTESKKTRRYSGTNPPYLEAAAAEFMARTNIHHLLIDLPSIDREVDEGRLSAHKSFWRFQKRIRNTSTITELIYVDNTIPDGLYLLNLQIISLEMDASPSKPVLFKLTEVS
jgi:kynurenine formamidase